MKVSRFRLYKAGIGAMLGICVGIAISIDIPVIALAGVVIAILLAVIVERGNKEIVRDERISQISTKAAAVSFTIILITSAAASLGTALFRSQLPENIIFAGSLMGYFICVAMLIYICFYLYYSRKL
jgi:uncharacterized membrane protein